jgi:hypothetical protein
MLDIIDEFKHFALMWLVLKSFVWHSANIVWFYDCWIQRYVWYSDSERREGNVFCNNVCLNVIYKYREIILFDIRC